MGESEVDAFATLRIAGQGRAIVFCQPGFRAIKPAIERCSPLRILKCSEKRLAPALVSATLAEAAAANH